MKKLNYGIIGCGTIAHTHANAIQAVKDAEISACFDVNEKASFAFSQKYGCKHYNSLSELLSDSEIDAVAVCTPCSFHSETIYQAALHKKHILCEKPIDLDLVRLKKLIDHCDACGVHFAGIMQHRYDPAVEAAKKAIAANNLGELLCGYARVIWYRDDAYYTKSPWRTSRENGGSVMTNQGIHYIDLLLYLFGDCSVVNGNCCVLGKEENSAENYASAHLAFKNGAKGSIECMTVAYPGICSELGIHGKDGSVIIRNDELFFYDTLQHKIPELNAMMTPNAVFLKNKDNIIEYDGHLRQYEDFTGSVLRGSSPRFHAKDSLKTLQLIDAIERAALKSSPVLS